MTTTHLMGILNITPDSYFGSSRYPDPEKAYERALELVALGADIIDVGAESTRPPQIYKESSFQIDEKEELRRLKPVLNKLKGQLPVPVSIDTMKPAVAQYACDQGASIINDVGGFQDPLMRKIAADYETSVCIVHMQGTPATMQENPNYPKGIIPTIIAFFQKQIDLLIKEGVKESNIWLDPGIGFGKTVAHNLEILQTLPEFKNLGFPLLLGTSRKMFLSKIVGKPTQELLPATLATSALMIRQGVDILRVHDVGEHHDLRKILAVL